MNIEKFFLNSHGNEIFLELGLLIIVASVVAFVARRLKQPLIPAYIVTGLLIGPVFGLITNKDLVTSMSEIGIAFLLFIVGLEMDLKKLKSVALVAGMGGLIRCVTMFTVGFVIALTLGFVMREALYIGLIISFSSTMIVIKLLSDKRELDTLHGRIIVGILLLEDIVAILALSVLTTLDGNSVATFALAIVKGLILASVIFLFTKFGFPKLFKRAAESQELLFLSSISICFLFSIMAYAMGFSIAIGAFVGGLGLANLPYNLAIIGRVRSLRDFFSTIFFVSLGMELLPNEVVEVLVPMTILLVVVLLFKPLLTLFLCSFFGYKRRVGFKVALGLAQISEFSLIIVTQGYLLKHISHSIFTLTVLVSIITMIITSYFIKYDTELYSKFKSALQPIDQFTEGYEELEYIPGEKKIQVVLCGYNRVGYGIGRAIARMKKKLLTVDYNPEIIREMIREKKPCLYGDISDIEVLERLPLKDAEMVISTVPSAKVNRMLIDVIKEQNKKCTIYVTASSVEKALTLYDHGADYVILPHFLGGEHVSLLIEKFSGNIGAMIKNKLKHINELKHRQRIGHENPNHQAI